MKRQAEKIKVPSLGLPWAVIERHWTGDEHPTCERLCSWDRLVATFAEQREAEKFMCKFAMTSPAHEFQVIETSKLKAVKMVHANLKPYGHMCNKAASLP